MSSGQQACENQGSLGAEEFQEGLVTFLVGFETDVCIAHSAIGLLQQEYKVAVVSDATASPGRSHEIGLERMRRAGVVISSVKSLFYEWVRTVERCDIFMQKYKKEIGLPQGIVL